MPTDYLQIDKNSYLEYVIYAHRGSTAHNMYVPPGDELSTDDVDYMGITISSIDYYLGMKNFEGMEIKKEQDDIVIYDIKKFFRLLSKGNPNVLSLLWLIPEHYITLTDIGMEIINKRKMFSSKEVVKSFIGYASGQMYKMQHQAYQGYMGEKRKIICDRFGYDTKNAAHMIRLLRMCNEFLDTNMLQVFRVEDRDELIDIKLGRWSFDSVVAESEKILAEIRSKEKDSILPDHVDEEAVNSLLVNLMEKHFNVNVRSQG